MVELLFKKLRMSMALMLVMTSGMLVAQSTPGLGANSGAPVDADCPDGQFDQFTFTENDPVSDPLGGTGEASNGDNVLGLIWEYEGNSNNLNGGTTINTTTLGQSAGDVEIFTFTFDQDMTNPVIRVTAVDPNNVWTITDCEGVEISSASRVDLQGTYGSSGTSNIQVLGTYACLKVQMTLDNTDAYGVGVGSCIPNEPAPDVPSCSGVTCTDGERFRFLSLRNYDRMAASGDVFLGNLQYGSFEVLAGENGQPGDLDVNVDGSGTQFGGWDRDGGTLLMRLDLCQSIDIKSLDIRNLEVESEVQIGTVASSMGIDAVLSGLTLETCFDPSGRMAVEANPDNGVMNFIKTDGPGCGANPNGGYQITGNSTVSTLYFKYHNPVGGCSNDYVGFRIGVCEPATGEAIPECPLTLVTVTTDSEVADGTTAATTANTDTYLVDANGNYFNRSTCYPTDADGLPILPTDPVALAAVSPCAEVIEEELCGGCTPPPPCSTCPDGNEYEYINLARTSGDNSAGEGTITLDGVFVGTYAYTADLDVSVDGVGTQFGGWDNDGGFLNMELNFCSPITAQQLDIRNLESQSIVTLTGATIMQCDGPISMAVTGGTGTVVESAHTGSCGPNPNGSYSIVSGNPITSLTLRYENPVPASGRNCRGDYVGFRIGVCVEPAPEAVPECTLNLFDVTTNGVTEQLYKDANGLYFSATGTNNVCTDPLFTTAQQTVKVSPCATETFVSVCENCFIPPVFDNVAATCNPEKPVITKPFTVSVTGLENMKAADNNEVDFGLNVYLYPAGTTAADFDYPPSNAITLEAAAGLTEQPMVPVLLGTIGPDDLTNDCTEGSLTVTIPADFPQGAYSKVITLDQWPTGEDPADQPMVTIPEVEVIPTMGQWALFILALLMSSLAVVRLRQIKNHEVKELA